MLDKNTEAKNQEDITSSQTAPAGEQNDDQNPPVQTEEGQEEQVTISKKELEDLKKRADDFNRSIELKRLKKLGDQSKEADADIASDIQALKDKLSSMEATSYNTNLSEAYRTFVADNPWANEDSMFDKIKENFVTVGTETKEQLLAKFKTAAQIAFPVEYEKHLEDKIKAKVLSSKPLTPDGGSANSATTIHQDNKPKTEEDLRKERLGSLLRKNMTWIKK